MKPTGRSTVELDVRPGEVIHRYTKDEACEWEQRWRAVYASNGAPGLKQYLWNTFSHGAYHSVSGVEAERCYAKQDGLEFIVLANDRRSALLTNTLPRWCSRVDVYVFPPDLAWTMAFTHEDGWLGPYFAQHPDYAVLTRQRTATQHKQLAIEHAKRHGWIRDY